MSTPEQMWSHELNPVKGWWDEHALDKSADILLTDGDVLRAGMVMSLGADAKFRKGLGCGDMAIFALQNSFDFDVVSDDGGLVGSGGGGSGSPVPRVSGLVAVGGYELQSTEFDTAYRDMLVPNLALTAGGPGEADAGLLKPGTPYSDTICAVCSDGVKVNENAVDVVQFWGVWLPPVTPCAAESSESLG